ncbi:tripartite tricarboxylate transporter substrate binding protein [Roseomonas sp. HJA6]|uniref:Tripartite tricarboxylate transporter substrate binding protein n=1 Tax=Roseomonas alba TaxID=2846776 RepID=A0ABS7ADT1_9PROT|nr:tripartite tricarboxylate transporter substrate binding protein [Neoroseomonas alba]MBW6400456.1 tripartite tricarboxylate transporter substrate binding protein [Neoroseomonas alba]
MTPVTRRIALALGTAGLAAPALAQDWPSRPVRIVAPAPAGGASDIYARICAQRMSDMTGRPFIVENRAGAAGRIGLENVVRSAPDGYSLLLGSSAIALARALYPNLGYDPVGDLTPIALMARTQQMMVVPAALPVTDVRSFIAYAKARPGELAYASSGVGNPPHLAAELFNAMAGLTMTHVPYGGDTPALIDIIAGRVQMYFGSVAPALPHREAGRVRALAVTGPTRARSAPDVPTMQEAGLPGYNVSGWFGLLAPRGTPREIILRLNEMMTRIMAIEEVRATLERGGADPADPALPVMEQAIVDSTRLIGEAVRIANIRAEG